LQEDSLARLNISIGVKLFEKMKKYIGGKNHSLVGKHHSLAVKKSFIRKGFLSRINQVYY